MNTKQIWVIEQGCYSDYRVVGVYSSKENAQMIADKININESYDAAEVKKWTLDPMVSDINAGLKPFHITMDKSGNTERVGEGEIDSHSLGCCLSVWKRSRAPAYKNRNISDAVHGFVWAKDEKHAIKITNEFRVHAIADGKMMTNNPKPKEATE